MNRARIIIVVPEMSDEEALALKKELERLVNEWPGATVEITLRPARRKG